MFETNNVIKIPDPFLKILCDLMKLYDHKRVNINPKYLIIMLNYCNCAIDQRQI